MSYAVNFEYNKADDLKDAWDNAVASSVEAEILANSSSELDDQLQISLEVLERMLVTVGKKDGTVVINVSGETASKHKGDETLIITIRTV